MKMFHQNLNLFLNVKDSFNFPAHVHDAVELVFVTEGQTVAVYGNRRITLSAGDLFVVFPNQIHGYEDVPGVKGYCMGIPMTPYLSSYQQLLEDKEPVDPVLHRVQLEPTGVEKLIVEAAVLWKQFPKNIMQSMRQGYILLIMGKLLQLMPLMDVKRHDSSVVHLLLQYINQHYHEPLTREDIAKAVGYHESYISHIFSQTLGITLSEYLTVLRINDAKLLLTESSQAISQIAMSLGFGSIRSFNRTFSDKLHMSPSAYRASVGKSR